MAIRESWGERFISIFNYTFIIFLCIITLYPFVYVFMYSISDGVAASAKTITFYPIKPTLINYKTVFANKGIMSAFLISIARTLIGSILHVFVTAMAAYSISKKDLLWRKGIMIFFIIPMYFSGGLLPYYVLVTKLGLQNNFLVYILPMVFNGFHMLIFKVFFEQIPRSIEESAKIDGAGDFTVFYQIVIPASLPVIATIFLFIGVAHWNSWFDAFLFITKPNLYPLQTLLQKIILESQTKSMIDIMKMMDQSTKSKITPEAIKMATLMVATVPILIVYPFMQKYFVKGMMIGAVKG